MTSLRCLTFLAVFATAIPEAAFAQSDRVYRHGVVAADHPLASQAGLEMLKQGGNVVDAAVATSFALSVVRPSSCGIGGGGFMIIWDAKKNSAVALDYRETAPKAASREMFMNAARDSRLASREGGMAVAVPGDVAGLCYALEHYGTLDIKTVLAPAIRYAKDGVKVDPHQRGVQQTMLSRFAARPEMKKRFANLYKLYLNGGKPWLPGDRFHSPQLKQLKLIAEHGAKGFYAGEAAKELVATVKATGGVFTLDDLANIKPKVRKPLEGEFRGHRLLVMPPPSSGGIAMLETLNIITEFEKTHREFTMEKSGHNRPGTVHVFAEAMKHAFADRAEFLGDADFAKVPVGRLISRSYAAELAKRVSLKETGELKDYGRFQPIDDSGTSHFSVMDAAGNAVACTETINTYFGSFVVTPTTGLVLNDEMDDFAALPGKPNAFGLLQSEANAVAPGKKPLSSMSPTIVLKDGKAVHTLGASGGPRIITATTQALVNLLCYKMSPHDAVSLPRFHHQWVPHEIAIEDPLFGKLKQSLGNRGHVVKRRNKLAVTQAVSRSADGLRAASDPRKHGSPAGY